MDIVKASLFIAFWVFNLVAFSFFSQASAEELDIIIDDWPPYIDRSHPNQGFISEIVTNSFEKMGIKTNLIYKPWKRVELDVDNRGAVSFGWVRNKDRESKWLFSDKITVSSSFFLTRKDSNISWKTLDDLKTYQIGITRGYSHGNAFDDFKSQLMIQEAATDEHNIGKLLKRRIDLFAVDPSVGATLLRTRFSREERNQLEFIMEPEITSHGIYVVCAKSNNKCSYYLEKFKAGMELL